jgi:hypothetical protein
MKEITDAHGISHATAKRSIQAGIVAAFTRPQPGRPGYVEYWFLPEQIGPALRVWQSRGIEMHDCSECPHDEPALGSPCQATAPRLYSSRRPGGERRGGMHHE